MDYLFITIVVFLTACGQVLQKLGADRGLKNAKTGRELMRALFQWEIILAIVCLGTGLLLWLVVLYRMDVSKAFPFISSGFILVLLAARFILHESITWWRWTGVLFIVAGISLLART